MLAKQKAGMVCDLQVKLCERFVCFLTWRYTSTVYILPSWCPA